jgi:hypothetical protein
MIELDIVFLSEAEHPCNSSTSSKDMIAGGDIGVNILLVFS